jgi:hypothetical protein
MAVAGQITAAENLRRLFLHQKSLAMGIPPWEDFPTSAPIHTPHDFETAEGGGNLIRADLKP